MKQDESLVVIDETVPVQEFEPLEEAHKDEVREIIDTEAKYLSKVLGAEALSILEAEGVNILTRNTNSVEGKVERLPNDYYLQYKDRVILLSVENTEDESTADNDHPYIVKVDFAFIEDFASQLTQQREKDPGNLFKKQNADLELNTLSFLRFMKKFIHSIDRKNTLYLEPSDEQRARLYLRSFDEDSPENKNVFVDVSSFPELAKKQIEKKAMHIALEIIQTATEETLLQEYQRIVDKEKEYEETPFGEESIPTEQYQEALSQFNSPASEHVPQPYELVNQLADVVYLGLRTENLNLTDIEKLGSLYGWSTDQVLKLTIIKKTLEGFSNAKFESAGVDGGGILIGDHILKRLLEDGELSFPDKYYQSVVDKTH